MKTVLSILGLCVIASMSTHHLLGRPEHLAQLLIIIGIMARKNPIAMPIICGVIMGVHPIVGVMALLIYFMWFAYSDYGLNGFEILFSQAMVAGLTFLLTFTVSPYSAFETLSAIHAYGAKVAHPNAAFTLKTLLAMFMWDPALYLFGPFLVLGLGIAGAMVYRNWSRVRSKVAFIASGLALAGVVVHFCQVPCHTYYVSVFAPILVFIGVRSIGKINPNVLWAFAVSMALASSTLMAQLYKFPLYMDSGVKPDFAKSYFRTIADKGTIYALGSSWTLADDLSNVRELGAAPEAYRGEGFKDSVLIVPQNFESPVQYGDFRRICQIVGYGPEKFLPGHGFTHYEYKPDGL